MLQKSAVAAVNPHVALVAGGGGADRGARFDPGMKKQYLRRCHQKPKGVAKVAAARKLAVRLYWMLRTKVGIRRSFASRAARGCPWSVQARPLD